ncbi:PTS fructose transporter subunit IIABC [Ligilactobacillus pobuzihii]|uniref:fructose-specific PTS transporter subunit EIIC n=1 Tax=Ligilactobacillus pobuzihii TaxID=449659 RepID=UPI0019D2F3A4|nr:fructose-specific PTS transporter subunit EIIC [Ligilactobacillus pobuzihii]MBN7274530.1 PTS fructose transporter subunit IIABC [Ligilactobacillus pobuzihii]
MANYDIVAATGCATGIAHTFMAEEALEQAAKNKHLSIKVETHGQTGIEHSLTSNEIKNAKAVIIASDIDVDTDRFAGKKLVNVKVAKAISDSDKLIELALSDNAPIHKPSNTSNNDEIQSSNTEEKKSIGNIIYTSLMNGVSHMLPLVVAGGVLTAISFFWGIYSADPKSDQFNQFAYMLNTIGGTTMDLMVPVLAAYIGEAIAKRSGLVVGFAVGMIAFNGGSGFLGAIVGGYIAALVILGLQKVLKPLPDKQFRGLKSIFLYPVLGVFIAGILMMLINVPMKALNTGMMDVLKGMENTTPLLLGIIIGCLSAADFGGPLNKAAYLTGTALLAQGNYFFMAGVSAACIAPPLATGFAVLFNKKAYSKEERSAGYVNFLLGSTHITEGAIPFAATNPLFNIPAFMVGSSIATVLTYFSKIQVPAPHGGFIVLPLVNHPILWVVYILIGSIVSGILLAIIAERSYRKKNQQQSETAEANNNNVENKESSVQTFDTFEKKNSPASILNVNNIAFDVNATDRNDALHQLSKFAEDKGLITNSQAVYQKYLQREQEGSTGMEQGIAIPHAQDSSIKSSTMVIFRLKNEVKWKTFDEKPVNTIISFLIPEKDNGTHLNYLSDTAKLLTHQDFIQKLKDANNADEIYDLFERYNEK